MKTRIRSHTALYWAFITLGLGFLLPNLPALTRWLGISESDKSLVAVSLVTIGIFLSGYSAIGSGRRKTHEKPVNVEEVIEQLRSFEEHQEARREQKARTLYYDEFRIPSAISAEALNIRLERRPTTDLMNSAG